jgi:sn-glycerol 3-phosphate transport system permease protein
MEKRVLFRSPWLPYALIAPQLAITLVFFFWPASQALYYSMQVQDAFGTNTQFVWFENFQDLFRNEEYLASFKTDGLLLAARRGAGLSDLARAGRSSPTA